MLNKVSVFLLSLQKETETLFLLIIQDNRL